MLGSGTKPPKPRRPTSAMTGQPASTAAKNTERPDLDERAMKTFNAPRLGRRAVTVGIMIAVLIVLLPAEAYAQGAAGGTLDTIVDRFKEATTQWEGAI